MSETVIITKDLFMDLVYNKAKEMRELDRKGLSGTKEVLNILGCCDKTFRNRLKEKGCLIKKSSIKGKYLTESIYKERDRER